MHAAPRVAVRGRGQRSLALARAAYHLGNRHIPLQIDGRGLRYQHDHVLDDMVRSLGLPVHTIEAPFQPEGGAYAQGHHHGHSDGDGRSRSRS